MLAATATAGADRAGYSCAAGPDVSFRAADGTKLVGHVFGTGRTAVVLGHQSQGSLCEWVFVRAPARAARLHGLRDRLPRPRSLAAPRGAAANRLAADLAAAVKLMRKRGKHKVFLVGASMGGIASLVAGANVKPAVDGVVSVSAPGRFMGMDAVATAPRLRVPVLYLAAEGDDNAGYDFSEDARELHAATAAADKRLESCRAACTASRSSPARRGRGRCRGFLKGH